MRRWFDLLRDVIHPRAGFPAREAGRILRGSDVIIGMMLALVVILGLALTITRLLA